MGRKHKPVKAWFSYDGDGRLEFKITTDDSELSGQLSPQTLDSFNRVFQTLMRLGMPSGVYTSVPMPEDDGSPDYPGNRPE